MALRAHSLMFAYHPDRTVIKDVTCEFAPGALTGILGPNASGKTTLLRLLLGLRKPDAGSVTLDGRDVHRLPARERAARLAYAPQAPSLAFAFSVRETVALARSAIGASARAAENAMALVGIKHLADASVQELSAGQRQLVSLARAMAQLDGEGDGRVLLADEPFGPLDPAHARRVREAFGALAGAGVAVGLVIHDITTAVLATDSVIVLDRSGRLAGAGPAREVCTPELLEEVYGVAFHRQSIPGGREAILPAFG